jgi:hypothetical protein
VNQILDQRSALVCDRRHLPVRNLLPDRGWGFQKCRLYCSDLVHHRSERNNVKLAGGDCIFLAQSW